MMTRGGRITQASLDGLLQAVPLAEYIGQTVSLRRQSGRWVGLCPFHSESSPSFYVFDDHYHCFGCGAHGKAIDFEMHRSGASFPEAAQNLAMRYGVTLESHGREASAAVEEKYRKRLTLTAVLEEVSAFYQRCLAHSTGARALDYLLAQRGFTPETLNAFGLGYAPPQNTLETLSKRKLWSTNLLIELGLLRPSNSGGPQRRYDLMRDRVIVPIHDERGSLVGFGGRELPGGGHAPEDERGLKPRGPKYLNSPESELFAKSSLLFNFHRARKEMVRKKSALVVEGYMDVIKLVQAGFENVVGVLGTALTAEHIKMLARATEHVILCFDGDEAGRKAMMRSFEKAWPLQLVRLSAVQIPAPAKDPDEFVSLHGPEAMTRLLQEARPLLQTVVQAVTAGLPYREERMLAVRNQVLPCIATCPQEAARTAALRDIAEELGLPSHRPLEAFVRGLQTRAKTLGGEQAKAADGPKTPLVQGATGSPRPQVHGTTSLPSPDTGHHGEPEPSPGGNQDIASQLRLASASELRFLLLLLHATWDDVPETLADIVSGRPGRDVTATLITLRTLQTVLSPQAVEAVDALIQRMYPGPMPSLAIAEGEGLTGKALASVLVAIESQDVPTLERFGLAPRRLARTDPTTGRFHADQSLLSADNLAFVKFLDRDAALAKMQSTIASQIAKILVGFEVMYLDRELALWSLTEQGRGQGGHDQTNRYRRVLEERARRLMQRSETTSGSGH